MTQAAVETPMTDSRAAPKARARVDAVMRTLLIVYLSAIAVAGGVAWWASFPQNAKLLEGFRNVVSADIETGASLRDKIIAKLDIAPRYLIVPAAEPLGALTPIALGRPVRARRVSAPAFRSAIAAANDYLFVVGAFDFEEALHGAALFDRSGRVLHTWPLAMPTTDKVRGKTSSRFFAHGAELFEDGSVIVTFDAGMTIARYDACGALVWSHDDGYHHTVTRDTLNPGAVWSWRRSDLILLDAETGRLLETIPLDDIKAANPDLDLFGVRQRDFYQGSEWAYDPTHMNDIEPLPADLAAAFPGFEAGDLLLSFRSLNLLVVIDRSSKRVKWQAFGYWRRQHDPDWLADGTISVYDNNMNRGASSIKTIDPQNRSARPAQVLVDGADYGFYSRIRGAHQVLDDGRVLITAPDQGRAFEVGPDGAVTFEFINWYDKGRNEALAISEATSIPKTELNPEAWSQCESS